jgi:hypothetical protein
MKVELINNDSFSAIGHVESGALISFQDNFYIVVAGAELRRGEVQVVDVEDGEITHFKNEALVRTFKKIKIVIGE